MAVGIKKLPVTLLGVHCLKVPVARCALFGICTGYMKGGHFTQKFKIELSLHSICTSLCENAIKYVKHRTASRTG